MRYIEVFLSAQKTFEKDYHEFDKPKCKISREAMCDFPHKLERFVKHIVASRFEQKRL